MIPVANIGASGLSDEQVNLVLKNKAKNAGVGVEALKRRGFFYGVVGEFEVTNAACDFYGQRLTVTLNKCHSVGIHDRPWGGSHHTETPRRELPAV